MRRFRFRFESVEKYRKNIENDALRALAETQRALQAKKQHKDSLFRALGDALARRETLASQSVSCAHFQIEDDFIAGTKVRIVQADQAIKKAMKVVERAMQAYLHARRQTRMMEVLREKELEKFKLELAKQEQKRLDDLYIMRAAMAKEEA